MNSPAAPCGARAVLPPRKISAEATKPVSTLLISKPAFRTHSAQQASSRISSVIVAALYPFWPRQALKSSRCGASQRSRSATFCGFLRLCFAIMIPSVQVRPAIAGPSTKPKISAARAMLFARVPPAPRTKADGRGVRHLGCWFDWVFPWRCNGPDRPEQAWSAVERCRSASFSPA